MTFDHNATYIYVDGSARPTNPGPGGVALIIEFPDDLEMQKISFKKGFIESTNQRMELRACLEGMMIMGREMRNWKKSGVTRVVLVTDSQYVFNHYPHAENWRANDWKNKQNKPILNHDLWRDFLSLLYKTQPEIQWSLGKKSDVLREVDQLAKSAAVTLFKYPDVGYIRSSISRTSLRGAMESYPARSDEAIVRVYKHRLIQEEYQIGFELYDKEENIFIGKYFAYASANQKKDIHRHHWYKVRFNGNPKYPQFASIESWARGT